MPYRKPPGFQTGDDLSTKTEEERKVGRREQKILPTKNESPAIYEICSSVNFRFWLLADFNFTQYLVIRTSAIGKSGQFVFSPDRVRSVEDREMW